MILQKKYLVSLILALSSSTLTYAAAPLSLSGPIPALPTSIVAGSTPLDYVYTLNNITNLPIAVTQTVSGNSASVSIRSACGVVPAHGQCTFTATIAPTITDVFIEGIQDTISVLHDGRIPYALHTSVSLPTTEPPLLSIVIAPSTSTNILDGSYLQYTATGIYENATPMNISAFVDWQSSQPAIANFLTPVLDQNPGIITTLGIGSTNVTASRHNITSNTASLSTTSYTYVANESNNTVSICPFNGTSFETCSTTSALFSEPQNIAINPQGTIAYVTDSTGHVSYCTLDTTTGALNSCTYTGNGFYQPIGISIGLNNRYAYIADINTGVISCLINPNNGQFETCFSNAGASNILWPRNIIVNPAYHVAYISNPDANPSYLYTCDINQTTGTISNCIAQNTGISSPGRLAITTPNSDIPSTQRLYVTSGSSSVYMCDLDSGVIGTCSNATGSNSFDPIGLSIPQFGTTAYITNANATNEILSCPIQNDGILGTCIPLAVTGTTFDGPQGLLMR